MDGEIDGMGWSSNVIDPEVYLEWQTAYSKAGMTSALWKAYQRLPILLSMKPETVEAYMETRFHEV